MFTLVFADIVSRVTVLWAARPQVAFENDFVSHIMVWWLL